jgi:ATP-dependent DNA helicase RecQ
MTTINKEKALLLLRQALDNPNADFRDGQWEAIEDLLLNKSRLLVVQRTGWGKSLVYTSYDFILEALFSAAS